MKHFNLFTILLICPILPSSLYGQELKQEFLHEVINTTLYLPLKKQDAKKIANEVPIEIFELIMRPGIEKTLPLIAQDFDQTIENYLARTTKKAEPTRYLKLFKMISNRIANVINQEKIDTKGKSFTQYPAGLSRDIYTFLLTQHNLKFVLEKAVRQVALTKLHRYLNQLPETCPEFINHYGFYPERWHAYTHRTIPISQELRQGAHTITTNNNRDTLYALDKHAKSILHIDAQTLKVIKQSPAYTQSLLQPAYDQKTDSILVRTSPKGNYYSELIKYDIKTKTFNPIFDFTTENFIMCFSQNRNKLFMIYKKAHELVTVDLTTLKHKGSCLIDTIFKDYFIRNYTSIDCAKISPDGSKILLESDDETIRVVDIQEHEGKTVFRHYASLKNALSATNYLTNCFTQSGLFEIYRPCNNLLSLWKVRKGKSKEECRIPINFYARQSPYTDTKYDWIDTHNYLSPNKTAFSDPQLKQIMFPMREDQIPTYEESHEKHIYSKVVNGEEILVMSGGHMEEKYKIPPTANDNCNYILTTTNDEKILMLSKPNEFTELTPEFNLYQAALLYKLRKATSKPADLQATFKKFKTAHYYDPRDGKDAKKKRIFNSFTPEMQIFLES